MIDGQFVLFAGAIAATPEMAVAGRADAIGARSRRSQPWSNGRAYLNFAENPIDAKAGLRGRVVGAAEGDPLGGRPGRVFVANHVVPRFYENGRPACEACQQAASRKRKAPQSMSLRGLTIERSNVTSPSSRTIRQTPPASSPADAVSCLTERILGFRPIPPSLAGGRERFLLAPPTPPQPLHHKKTRRIPQPTAPSTEAPTPLHRNHPLLHTHSTETSPPLWKRISTSGHR